MKDWRLALTLLGRDWRSGQLRLLALALVLVVAAVTSVGWLAERVAGASGRAAAELLAADAAVETSTASRNEWVEEAQRRGLQTARTAEFPSVVLAGDRAQLVSVKAAEPAYPLRGELRIRPHLAAPEQAARGAPEPGRIWVDPALLNLLDIEVGDSIALGRSELRVEALIALEADRGGLFSGFAPRVLMNWGDLEATGLIQPASRVRYELLLAGPPGAVEGFRDWLDPDADPAIEWELPAQSQPGVNAMLERAQRFLGLSALLTVLVAAVALLISVRHYAVRQLDQVAVMRCMGATSAQMLRLLVYRLLWLGVAAIALGAAGGYLLHLLMIAFLSEWLPELPAPTLRPLLTGAVTALAVLLGFVLPTVARLRQVPPVRVLRRDLGGTLLKGSWIYLFAVAAIFLLIWWQARDPLLAGWIFTTIVAGLGGMTLLAFGVVLLLRRERTHRVTWLAGLTRRPWQAAVEVAALGVGLLALLLLAVVRGDLLEAWQNRVPPDAPNYFLINIQPDEVADLREFLVEAGAVNAQLYPMIRGRLVAIGGERIDPSLYEDPRARRLAAREFNLSVATEVKSDNRVVAGRFWGEEAAQAEQYSVEAELAELLGIELGDSLSFAVAGETFSGTVTSLREVEWDSFQANFFVVSPPALLADAPQTWISSFHLPETASEHLPELVRRFPSVTLIDVGVMLRTVLGIVEQGSRAVAVMAALTLTAGALVLLAALQVSARTRRFEIALMRALGASRWRLRWYTTLEFALIGLLAGAMAGLIAGLLGYYLAEQLFELAYAFRPSLMLIGAFSGAVLAALAGGFAVRGDLRASPMQLLREQETE